MTARLPTYAPPWSNEAEQAVLGALLIDNRVYDEIGHILSPDRFHVVEHRAIFTTIHRLILACKPADVVTVHEAGAHDLALLYALSQAVITPRHARRYAEIVAEHWTRREMVRVALGLLDDAQQQAENAKPVAEVADAVAGRLLELISGAQVQSEPVAIEDAVLEFIDHINAMHEGEDVTFKTGLHDVDEATAGGGREGELWVLGARPSMGKSALLESLTLKIAEQHETLVLTQEDSKVTWVSRAVANLGRVNLADLRNPVRARDKDAMWAGVAKAVDTLPALKLLLDDQGGLTLSDVRRKVKQAKRKFGGKLKLVVVDYLQLMSGDGDNRNQMLGQIANGLKALAKEMHVWIVLLSQLSRKADEVGLPQIAHLRDSGDIEGAADTIALLHREAMRKKTEENKHWAQLHIAKQKNGPTCTVNLFFDGAHQRFGDWSGPPPTPAMQSRSRHTSGGLD